MADDGGDGADDTEVDFVALWKQVFDEHQSGLRKKKEGDESGACDAFQKVIDIVAQIKQTGHYMDNKDYCDKQLNDPHSDSLMRLKHINSPELVTRLHSELIARQNQEGAKGGIGDSETESIKSQDEDSENWSDGPTDETEPEPMPPTHKGRKADLHNRRASDDCPSQKAPLPRGRHRRKLIADTSDISSTQLKGRKRKQEASNATYLEDEESNMNTIVVEGAEDLYEEDLETYFESTKGGSGDIDEVRRDDDDDNIVYITFRNCKDAKIIAQMKHKLRGKRLQVSIMKAKKQQVAQTTGRNGDYRKGTESKKSQDEDSEDSSETEAEPPSPKPKSRKPGVHDRRVSDEFKTQKPPLSSGRSRRKPAVDTSDVGKASPTTPKDRKKRQEANKSTSLEVEVPNINTVVVEGVDDLSEEDLELYFESKKGGSGDIAEIRRDDDDDNIVYITFKNCRDADRITQMTHKLKGKKLQVKIMKKMKKKQESIIYAGRGRLEEHKEAKSEDEMQNTNTVAVRGTDGISDEDLELYFGSKKGGAGDVEDIKRDEDDENIVYITFSSCTDADKIANMTHKFKARKLLVSLKENEDEEDLQCNDSDTNGDDTDTDEEEDTDDDDMYVLEVKGFPETKSEEDLELYFENKKRSGGKEVEKVEIYRETETALIYFAEGDAVRTVLRRAPFVFDKKKLDVAAYLPSRKSKGTSWLAGIKRRTVVKVHNTGVFSEDTLEMYFESKKKSGGIMKEMKTIEDEDSVYLIYENEQEAATVANRAHTLSKKRLQTTLYIPPRPRAKYRDRFFISGLNESTSKEELMSFLKDKAHCKATDISYGEEPGTALITIDTSDTPIRLKVLRKICNKRPLEGSFLEIVDVPVSNCILVRNVSEKTPSETLEFYFESKKSGNDGEVEVKEIKEASRKGEALVYFTEHGVINKVLKKTHKLGGNILDVSLYVECLGAGGGQTEPSWFKIPPPFTLERVNKYKIQFIKDKREISISLMEALETVKARFEWTSDTSVLFTCTFDEDTMDARKHVKIWKKNTEEKFETFLTSLGLKTFTVLRETWKDVSSNISLLSEDAAAVYTTEDTCTISVVGLVDKVGDLISQVERIIKNVEEDMERKKKEITETLTNIKPMLLRFLAALEFPKDIKAKFPKLEVNIDLKRKEICFTGQVNEIKSSQVLMYETINSDSKVTLNNMSQDHLDFLDNGAVQRYMAEKLKAMSLVGVWSIEKGSVTFLSRTDQEANDVAHAVKQSIKEQTIPLDADMLRLTTALPWRKMIDHLYKDRGDIVKITVKNKREIVVFGTDDIFDIVLEDLTNFLNEKTVYSRTVNLPKGIIRFLSKHSEADMKKITHTYRDYAADVICTENTITIKATTDGLGKLQREIEKLAQNISHEEKVFDHPGIAKLFTTEAGDQAINVIESIERCVIEKSLETDDQVDVASMEMETYIQSPTRETEESTGPRKLAICGIESKCTLVFWHGDITDLQVDVIVNAANEKLQHIGGLAKAVVDKGGLSIQNESNGIVRKHGVVMVGNIAVTDPGNLSCKKIIHAVGPQWNGGRDDEETYLQEAILNCLEETEQRNFNSLAIPALCTGIYHYPVQEAARVIIAAIADHLRDSRSSSITEIHLCDTNEATVKEFIESARKTFGRAHVKMERAKIRARSDFSLSSPGKSGQQIPTSSGTSKIHVKIEEGEIAKQKEDVIVNTTSTGLDLMNGAVSKSIATAGGKSLQQECHKYYPNGIQTGDFAITSAGRLSCKKVYHVCLPSWDNDQDCQILGSIVSECLGEASQDGYRSICFPALGTGKLGYPPEVVAKTFFETVHQYGVTNPYISLKEVTIVLSPKDKSVIKAFQNKSQESKLSPTVKNAIRSRRSIAAADDSWEQVDHKESSQVFKVGSVQLTVKTGDLTKENVQCIVNSTNETLDLTQGAVSQAIRRAGGQHLLDEIDLKRGEMRRNGVTSTTGRGLRAASIIHVSSDSFKKDWKRVILACLSEAGKQGINEIAFPALGTGVGSATPGQMAVIFVDALLDFQHSPAQSGLINDVRVVIFQPHMMASFVEGLQKTGNASKSLVGNFMKKAYDFFTGATGKLDITEISQTIQPMFSEVKLYFFSDEKTHIERAIGKLESRWKDLLNDEILTDPGLKNLDDAKRERIENLETMFGVKVEYQKRLGRVRLQGLSSDVIAAVNAVHKIILGAHLAEQQKEKAEILSSFIQWSYIEIDSSGDSNLIPYEKILNQKIEESYKNQQPNTTFTDGKGRLYMVDFAEMVEFPEDDDTDKVDVIRRDLMQGSVSHESLPSSWTKMTSESEMVIVTPGTQEYTDVETNFLQSVGGNHNVLRIDRVQTSFLWQQYVAKKRQLDAQNPGIKNELTLWHGTASDTIASIYKNGFNRSYCGKNATVYGEGVYFAVNASYSAQNTYSKPDSQGNKYMFQTKVLTGMFTVGQKGIRVPPPRDASKHLLFDSVVDQTTSPQIYVIFNDTQAYPEYLITFT